MGKAPLLAGGEDGDTIEDTGDSVSVAAGVGEAPLLAGGKDGDPIDDTGDSVGEELALSPSWT